jgi:hypothetical protein
MTLPARCDLDAIATRKPDELDHVVYRTWLQHGQRLAMH